MDLYPFLVSPMSRIGTSSLWMADCDYSILSIDDVKYCIVTRDIRFITGNSSAYYEFDEEKGV